MSSEIALYYPYIHFRDDSWVKHAALYWDRVGRIMPGEYGRKLHDSDTVKALRDDAGVVQDRQPPHEVVQSVSQELLTVVRGDTETLLQHLSPDPFLHGDTGSLAYIYHTKMDDELVYELEQSGLGTFRHRAGDAEGEWLGVHPKIGQAYMTALASSMGRRGALAVVSDNPQFTVAGCGFPVRQLFANLIEGDLALEAAKGDSAESVLGVAAMKCVLPENLAEVPIEKIIAFRKESIIERARYREAVDNATAHLSGITDPEALRDHLDVAGDQIQAAVEKLEGKMNKLLGKTVIGVVGVSKDLPDLITAGLVALGISTGNPYLATAGFAFNAYRAVRDKRRENAELRDQPYAYLVELREEFGESGMLDRLRTGARRLILG